MEFTDQQIKIAKAKFQGMTEKQSIDHQTKFWAKGLPLHNTVRNECCPDFSCCGGKLMDEPVRIALKKARDMGDDETVQHICMTGLSGLMAKKEIPTYLAGELAENEEQKH